MSGVVEGTDRDGKAWTVSGPPWSMENICLVLPAETNYTPAKARELAAALINAADETDGLGGYEFPGGIAAR